MKLEKMLKRTIWSVMAMCFAIVCSVIIGSGYKVQAAESDWEYSITNGYATVTGYVGTGSSITIPEKLGGYKVKAIGQDAFKDNTTIKSVTIPEYINTLGRNAFYNCSNLSTIVISADLADAPRYESDYYEYAVFYGAGANTNGISVTFKEGVTRIPANLFHTYQSKSSNAYCHITSVTIPNSVIEIGKRAFENCYDLKTINWGNSLKTIGSNAFNETGIENLVIPSPVKTIGDSAFAWCDELKSIEIPEETVSIEKNAFYRCDNLTNIVIRATELADAPRYESDYYEYAVFYGAGAATDGISVIFKEGVTRIPANLFHTYQSKSSNVYCHISSVTIPNSVTEIGERAFENCYDLKTINWGNSLKTIGSNAFNETGIENLVIPSPVRTIGDSAFAWCDELKSIEIPEETVSIGKNAFYECGNLTNIVIRATELADVEYSGYWDYGPFHTAGANTNGISVTFKEGVTRIPASLFATNQNKASNKYCHISSIAIPSSVTEIGERAIQNCFDLSSITYYGPSSAWNKITIGEYNGLLTELSCKYDLSNYSGWEDVGDYSYWYENGVKQGTEGRGKEIYDPTSDAWYWLDAVQGGAKAVSKDVYQESNGGKWVSYDENGHMRKGWYETDAGTYYFDLVTGAMYKGSQNIDGTNYYFDENTGIMGDVAAYHDGWNTIDGVDYWYENGVRQGLEGRGKEIYDPASDAWYWLDSVQNGAKAVNKDVYQESYSAYPDREDGTGKWVRYDGNGHMIKGWQDTEAGTYYFEPVTGAMAKGWVNIDGTDYYFNETTGIRQ